MYKFNYEELASSLYDWIRKFFADNGGEDTLAIIGISGGIDSAVAAALCVNALGKDRVIGVQLPDGFQEDIEDANRVIEHLDIRSYMMNIEGAVDNICRQLPGLPTSVVTFNTPARIRMTALYAYAGLLGGRVVNTCNLSETYVGFDTKFGDSAGDLAPLASLTKSEVRELAKYLRLPTETIEKAPQDGLCGQTDEERFRFSYETLDKYIREGGDDIELLDARRITNMHEMARHKILSINVPSPVFVPMMQDNQTFKEE